MQSPDFSQTVTLWGPQDKKRQDVYFQPALSWLPGGTKGIALLFLENYAESGDINQQDFRELTKALVQWSWQAAGKQAQDSIVLADVEQLYQDLSTTMLRYDDLKSFLQRHFNYVVQECATELEGTIFPMFPELEMQVGTNSFVSFSPQDKALNSTAIENLRNYFAQMQVQFEAGERANTIDAGSITEFLFVGYARLLMRSGIQATLDLLDAGSGNTTHMDALLNSVPNTAYANIAQMASRFMLHGFNLPENTFGPNDPLADEGIYQSTGQQFNFFDALDGADYTLTLKMGAVNQAHIQLPSVDGNGKPQLVFRIPNSEDALEPQYQLLGLARSLNGLQSSDLNHFHSPQPEAIPYYRDEQLHFALRSRIDWEQTSGNPIYILPLSSSLRNHLKQKTPNPIVDLVVWPDGNPAHVIDVDNADFIWATRIELTFAKVADNETGGFLKGIYQLAGSSEEDKDLLEDIWGFLQTTQESNPLELNLLYVPGGQSAAAKSIAGNQSDFQLIRSNLSNDHPDTPTQFFSANLSEKQRFIELVWEGLTVNSGGYFLSLPGLDDASENELFNGNSQAVIHFLLQFTHPADPIYDFHNCAVFAEEINVETDLVLARSEEAIPVLTIPPGFLGFQLKDRPEAGADLEYPTTHIEAETQLRQEPDEHATAFASLPVGENVAMIRFSQDRQWVFGIVNGGAGWIPVSQSDGNGGTVQVLTVPANLNEGPSELNVLYQLLGFQVANHTQFHESNVGLPISPTENPNAEGIWLYERMIPVYALAQPQPAQGPTDLPSATRNPYLGVGPASGSNRSELKLETWWQDIYGNQLLAGKRESLFPIRYTDPLLGINQWPSVAENYLFSLSGQGQRQLELTFSFDTQPYTLEAYAGAEQPEISLENRVRGDLATLEKVFYQLSQADVTFRLTTSVDPTWVFTAIDKAGLLEFVKGMYRFLNGILNQNPVSAPAPFAQTVDINSLSVQRSFIFEVKVELEMARDLSFVHEDLKSGGQIMEKYADVVKANAVLSPRFEASSIIAGDGESLAEIAASVDPAGGVPFSVLDLVRSNAGALNILEAGIVLQPDALNVDFTTLPLSEETWKAYLETEPAALTIGNGASLESLAEDFQASLEAQLSQPVAFGIEDLAAILANEPGIFVNGAQMRIAGLSMRPFAFQFQSAFSGLYLAVTEDRRNTPQAGSTPQPLFAAQLGSQGITFDIQEQQPIYYALPPLSNSLLSGGIALDNYAAWKATIPGELDPNQIVYAPEQSQKQFEAIDLNILARNFLVALEKQLDAATLVPANRLNRARVDSILRQKALLAAAISEKIQPVLQKDISQIPSAGQLEAESSLRNELLKDLVNGYDIETIVQFDVNIHVGAALNGVLNYPADLAPRVRGKARVLGIRVGEVPGSTEEISAGNLDYTLSPGKIQLANQSGRTPFTYLFDTKTPELFANLELELEFVPTQVEYDIENLSGISNYQASNWLNFILADDLRQTMGASPVPIPLRNYPTPPSLIFQRAEPDPTSLTELTDVRQWKYAIVYEHADISQDSIDCILQLNVLQTANLPTETGTLAPPAGLFRSLVNFNEAYPTLSADLNILRDPSVLTDPGKSHTAQIALAALDTLVQQIAADWDAWETGVNIYQPAEGDLHFEISEENLPDQDERQGLVHTLQTVASQIGGPALLPTLELPGYKQKVVPIEDGQTRIFTFEKDPEDLTFFGDSSVPDRRFTVENLDVIEHQNAWASVWLSRNKNLLQDANGPIATNPAFVFQTPSVRFNTMVTPFITNDEPWDISTLDTPNGQPASRTLEVHLQKLLLTLFPYFEGGKYEVRLSCRYAFALATGKGLNEDLLTTLPILIGLRITPEIIAGTYATDLANEILGWFQQHDPSRDGASLQFTLDLFSKLEEDSNTSLPMLRINRLSLPLEQIVVG